MLAVLLLLALAAPASTAAPDAADDLSRWLWGAWPARRVLEEPPPCVRPDDLETALQKLAAEHGDRLRVALVGRSVQGRPIRLLELGTGPEKVLLFSQMHGDEPSATPALLDLVDLLLSDHGRPELAAVLERFTLLVLPMLNPDGAEVYQRRNAQGIDVNRDALSLVTPEGRALKAVRDRHRPFLAFNLHDQNRRASLGHAGGLATIAVLAVSGDEAQTVTPGRLRAMRVCSAIVETLSPFVPGGIARYDEDWNPRAFGDNLTAWGSSVVLLESGGPPPGKDLSDLSRLDFVALARVLAGLAADDLAGYDVEVYKDLPRTASAGWVDVVVRGARFVQPGAGEPFRADLAFDLPNEDRALAGCDESAPAVAPSRVVEVGDARFLGARREVDATGRLVVPALEASVRGWRAREWLDREALAVLAQSGVAMVHWQVERSRLADARDHAARLRRPGTARLEATVAQPPARAIPIRRAPDAAAAGTTLEEMVARFAAEPLDRVIERLEGARALRPGVAASFLILVPATAGQAADDPWRARLDAVWIDGVEHTAYSTQP